MWLTKLKPDELSKLKKTLEVSYSCGATFDDLELPGHLANVCIKDHQCTKPIEKLHYSCDFEDICVHCGQEDQLQVDNDYFPQCQECQNVDRVKRPAKNTDVCMFYTFICPRVYVAFILDMMVVFNKIINNSRPPAWYFSLTRTGNKELIIVGLTVSII